MTKPKKPKRIELKIRTTPDVIERLKWIEFRRKGLKSRNEALLESLTQWLDRMESVYGKAPPPVEAPAEASGKHKRAG